MHILQVIMDKSFAHFGFFPHIQEMFHLTPENFKVFSSS